MVVGIGLLSSGVPVSADVTYETKIVGTDDSDLSDLLDDVSQLKKLEDKKPASEEALRRRADDDLERLKEAAHSLGYWDAQFSADVDLKTDPAKVTVTVQPGALYHMASIDVQGPGGKPLVVPLDPNAPLLPLKPGDPARSEPVVATENALLAALGHQGHPFAKKTDRRVVVDHGTQTMAVTYTLAPGPRMQFGAATISGLERLDPTYVQNRIQWRAGEVYDNRTVDDTRRRLIESGLFSSVSITPVTDPAHLLEAAVERGDLDVDREVLTAIRRLRRLLGVASPDRSAEEVERRRKLNRERARRFRERRRQHVAGVESEEAAPDPELLAGFDAAEARLARVLPPRRR